MNKPAAISKTFKNVKKLEKKTSRIWKNQQNVKNI